MKVIIKETGEIKVLGLYEVSTKGGELIKTNNFAAHEVISDEPSLLKNAYGDYVLDSNSFYWWKGYLAKMQKLSLLTHDAIKDHGFDVVFDKTRKAIDSVEEGGVTTKCRIKYVQVVDAQLDALAKLKSSKK